jgi:hypothetical protein
VDPDADADPAGPQRLPTLVRRVDRLAGVREGVEERVALRVDLDATVAIEGLAQQAAMLGQGLRVGLGAELVQQPRRPLDVGEHEGNGPGRQVSPHGRIMPEGCRSGSRVRYDFDQAGRLRTRALTTRGP